MRTVLGERVAQARGGLVDSGRVLFSRVECSTVVCTRKCHGHGHGKCAVWSGCMAYRLPGGHFRLMCHDDQPLMVPRLGIYVYIFGASWDLQDHTVVHVVRDTREWFVSDMRAWVSELPSSTRRSRTEEKARVTCFGLLSLSPSPSLLAAAHDPAQ